MSNVSNFTKRYLSNTKAIKRKTRRKAAMQKNRFYTFKRVCFHDVVRLRHIFFVNSLIQKALFFTNSFLSFHMISTPIRNLGDIAMWWLFFFIYFRLSFQNKFGYKRKYHFYENFCEQHTSGQMML